MGKLFLSMMVTLDGFTEGLDSNLEWIDVAQDDEEFNAHMVKVLSGIDAMIFGRRTYDMLTDYWPAAGRDSAATDTQREMARLMNTVPKIVVSHGAPDLTWGPATRIGDDVAAEVTRLKQESRHDLALFAGARTAASFLDLGLVDEYRLMTYPVLLGEGRRLFPSPRDRRDLRLVDTTTFVRSGVVILRYVPGSAP
ncbi:dihydrofolate reductase family protein [Phytoactinopolyspora limicola]|uniref:dihydrofolate reductase family protein n=1 Tax=Phytoactinopolyspora limicola TaxID=2715536 RepID=UPI00140C21FC|nr:dihydrofolate reductase family protein [Phytoactinopolyspora limicola]